MYSQKARVIKPFLVMEILERAQELERRGERVIHLEVGEPDFETPAVIKESAYQALRAGKTHYTHSMGILELREAIAKHYLERYGIKISPEQIIVTSGSSPAILLVLSTLLNPQDEIVISNPYYPCYLNFIKFLNAKPAFVRLKEEEGFQYHVEDIKKKISKRTKTILVTSPSNPTGMLISADSLKEIVELGRPIISDEIYHGLVYEGRAHSLLEFTEEAFIINGFSKFYAMTGWRLGYLVAPKRFIRPIQKMQQNFFISANSFVQWAGITALREAEEAAQEMVKIYNERRKYIVPRLREIGFKITKEPQGTYYVLANAKAFSGDSLKFAYELLEEAKVAVAPGIDFGSQAQGFLRFSYANSLENIKEALDRLEGYLKKRRPLE